jgi:2-succinyl-5-enolpyruvyl-6-hydroxy-3-cyclohexene-1-carboxylate synthase
VTGPHEHELHALECARRRRMEVFCGHGVSAVILAPGARAAPCRGAFR